MFLVSGSLHEEPFPPGAWVCLGVFVDTAIEKNQTDKELAIQEELRSKKLRTWDLVRPRRPLSGEVASFDFQGHRLKMTFNSPEIPYKTPGNPKS